MLNSDDGVNNMIFNYTIGQLTVRDEVCSNLSLNIIAENVGIVESPNLMNLSSNVFILILHIFLLSVQHKRSYQDRLCKYDIRFVW